MSRSGRRWRASVDTASSSFGAGPPDHCIWSPESTGGSAQEKDDIAVMFNRLQDFRGAFEANVAKQRKAKAILASGFLLIVDGVYPVHATTSRDIYASGR